MITFLKANCLALYALAVIASFVTMPWGIGPWFQRIGLALMVIHLLELPLFWGAIRNGGHPIWRACVESLLFGVLYWLGLRKSGLASPVKGTAS